MDSADTDLDRALFRATAYHFGVSPEGDLCPDIEPYVEDSRDLRDRVDEFANEIGTRVERRIKERQTNDG